MEKTLHIEDANQWRSWRRLMLEHVVEAPELEVLKAPVEASKKQVSVLLEVKIKVGPQF